MTWSLYRLRYRLLSGVHAGAFPTGNILKTRSYVTGRTMWGAATASLVAHGLEQRNAAGYEAAGEKVSELLRFGYLFPFTEDEPANKAPSMGMERSDEFEYCFLDTYSSTALHYGQGAAEEGSLHETEFIRPHTRPSKGVGSKQVTLAGYLATAHTNGVELDASDAKFFGIPLRNALSAIQVGGERSYGFGRLQLTEFARVTDIFGAAFLPEDGAVCLEARSPAPAHVEMREGAGTVNARVEPLVGREWRESQGFGSGQYITQARLCWGPGVTFESAATCTMDAFGVLAIRNLRQEADE